MAVKHQLSSPSFFNIPIRIGNVSAQISILATQLKFTACNCTGFGPGRPEYVS